MKSLLVYLIITIQTIAKISLLLRFAKEGFQQRVARERMKDSENHDISAPFHSQKAPLFIVLSTIPMTTCNHSPAQIPSLHDHTQFSCDRDSM